MNIQLKNWQVKNLSLGKAETQENKNEFRLSMGHFFPENNSKEFGVGFQIEIYDENFNISLEMAFLFQVDENVTNDFRDSDFVKINAPAIAFPYLRSYVSNLTLQSGFSPIILPSINFVEFAKQNK